MNKMRKSMATGTPAASMFGAGLAALLVGCLAQHEAPSVSDTATSWLHACQRGSDCAGANACIQNVCTLPCQPRPGNVCQSVHPEASCEVNAANAGVCDLACSSDAACTALGAGFVCKAGHCREDTPASTADSTGLPVDASGLGREAGPPMWDVGWVADAGGADASDATDAGTGVDASAVDSGWVWPAPVWDGGSQDPGCTTTEQPITSYVTQQHLETYFARPWIPCVPRLYVDDERQGIEFLSTGEGFDLSYVDGTYVRKGDPWRWEFSPSTQTLTVNGQVMSAPRITPVVNSAIIGVDPTSPRFVPLRW